MRPRPAAATCAAQLIAREELMSALREQGIHDISEVEEARLEGNGKLSVLGSGSHPPRDDDQPT